MNQSFIAFDWCGFGEQYMRMTHVPSGDTLVCSPWMCQKDWNLAQVEWLAKYPGLPVHNCPGAYTTDGTQLRGISTDLVRQLEIKLGWREKDETQTGAEAEKCAG